MLFFVMQTQPNINDIESLMIDLSNGDQNALDQLYLSTKSAVFGLALSILKNFSDAEDVLHDTFISLYVNAPNYQANGKPLSYILTITRNACLKKIRADKKLKPIDENEIDAFFKSHNLDAANVAENRLIIKECFELLNDEERQILVMHAVGGLKFREVSTLIDIPLPTVLSKYNRAIKKLQKHYGGN